MQTKEGELDAFTKAGILIQYANDGKFMTTMIVFVIVFLCLLKFLLMLNLLFIS